MKNQQTSYHTYFTDVEGSGLFVCKPDNASTIQNVQHKFVRVSTAAATVDGVIIPAVAGKILRVVQFDISCGSAGASSISYNTKPAGAGTVIYGTIDFVASEKFGRYFNPFGWFQSNVGEGISASTGATLVKSMIGYIEIG